MIGWGQDGVVYHTDVASVVKSLKYKELYAKELAVYLRLKERAITSVCGFSIPRLLDHHDELLVIEMEFVTPPFVVDFASCWLDADPLKKYDAEQLAEQFADWQDIFGTDWPRVKSLYYELRGLGIFLSDINTRNIVCEPTLPRAAGPSPVVPE